MKIVGLDILSLGEGGTRVNVAFLWEPNEQFDMNDVGGVLAWLQLHGLCGEGCMAQGGTVTSRITAEEKAALLAPEGEDDAAAFYEAQREKAAGHIEPGPSPDHGHVGPATRRRKPNPLEVADAGAAPLPEPATSAGSPSAASSATPASTETSTRRRRAPSADDTAPAADAGASSSVASAAPTEADAAPLRRRRAAPAAEGTPATTAPAEATAASPEPAGRRRRAAVSAESAPAVVEPVKETAPTPPASEPAAPSISDADMSKAASQGAAVLTPAVVRTFLAEFLKDDGTPCTSVNQVHPDLRRAFLDELVAKIAAAQ